MYIPLEPDCLKGKSILLSSPCGDSKFDDVYAFAKTNTLDMLAKLGATVDWGRVPGCADLPYARSKALGGFLRSKHTHMMMIDSDMGWEPIDVVRLITANRDFIGAAGPKKKPTREFAFNNCTDSGGLLPITYEADTGIMNITEVGMAFVMISRACAEKMVAHYHDLAFEYEEGEILHAVFDPFIIPGTKRRLAEDFAFCWRWRKIGGKVQIIPDITLQHCGRAIWEGNAAQGGTRPKANGHDPLDRATIKDGLGKEIEAQAI